MPLSRLVLILVAVIAAAAVTVALAVLLSASAQLLAGGLLVAIPVALIGYVAVRVIGDRVRSNEDGHYDRIEK